MQFLLDASAIINNPSFIFDSKNKYLMTPSAFDELKDMRSKTLAENALKSKILALAEPQKKFILKVEKRIKKMKMHLSKQDISLLALAEQLKNAKIEFVLITDDYSIQNYCKLYKIPFEPSALKKIKKAIKKFK